MDASTDSLHATLGRGTAPETGLAPDRHGAAARGLPPGRPSRPPAHLARVLGLWDAARRLGYRLKLNSVLTAANVGDEGLVELAGRLRPERWKVFQVGMNLCRSQEPGPAYKVVCVGQMYGRPPRRRCGCHSHAASRSLTTPARPPYDTRRCSPFPARPRTRCCGRCC